MEAISKIIVYGTVFFISACSPQGGKVGTNPSLSAGQPVVEIDCPEEIIVNETIETIPQGWESRTDKIPHRLNGASFSSTKDIFPIKDRNGKILDNSYYSDLMPDEEIPGKKQGITKYRWSFTDALAPYVLRCYYSRTSMELIRKIPENIHSCELTKVTDHSLVISSKVRCLQ